MSVHGIGEVTWVWRSRILAWSGRVGVSQHGGRVFDPFARGAFPISTGVVDHQSFGVSSGAKLAAGQPMPGFGVVERITVYTSLIWVAALATALLRRPLPAQALQPLGLS